VQNRTRADAVAVAVGLSWFALSVPAESADNACVNAFETGQEQRQKNELVSARELFTRCQSVCPVPFRDQCATWRSEIDAYLSSIRVHVTDPAGKELAIDAAYVDARTVSADAEIVLVPGEHLVRVEIGKRAIERRIVTKARERDKLFAWTLEPEPRPRPVDPKTSEIAKPSGSYVPSILAFAVGGASALAAASLTIYGHVRREDLASTCKPSCEYGDVTPIKTAWWGAAGLGVVAATGAILGIVLWPSKSTSVTASPQSIHLDVSF